MPCYSVLCLCLVVWHQVATGTVFLHLHSGRHCVPDINLASRWHAIPATYLGQPPAFWAWGYSVSSAVPVNDALPRSGVLSSSSLSDLSPVFCHSHFLHTCLSPSLPHNWVHQCGWLVQLLPGWLQLLHHAQSKLYGLHPSLLPNVCSQSANRLCPTQVQLKVQARAVMHSAAQHQVSPLSHICSHQVPIIHQLATSLTTILIGCAGWWSSPIVPAATTRPSIHWVPQVESLPAGLHIYSSGVMDRPDFNILTVLHTLPCCLPAGEQPHLNIYLCGWCWQVVAFHHSCSLCSG